jgi:hypothetical protein
MTNTSESSAPQADTSGTAVMEPVDVSSDLPSQEDIAVRAYFYWEARGCPDGSPEEDWLRAERELLGGSAQEQE